MPAVLSQFGSLYGTPLPDSIDVESVTPSIKVASSPSQGFPDFLHFEWEGVVRKQMLRVTGRPINVIIVTPLDISLEIVPKVIRGDRDSRPFRGLKRTPSF